MSNVLTMVQQVSINKYLARKKAAAAAGMPQLESSAETHKGRGSHSGPVIAPKKKKRK
jgi:membrane protein insertase Oxa1/YidC/SpoIIIJ